MHAAKPEFEEVCFDFGIELEEETSEHIMASKEVGEKETTTKNLSNRPIYRIDIPANRVDLLCPEGLVRALKVYLEMMVPPLYQLTSLTNLLQIFVKPETAQIRPFVVAAVLRDISFTTENFANFIELQEKLHSNICRKRTLVAIGTHDLDTVQGPFTYEALPPKEIKFIPLNQTVEMTGDELIQFYENDRRISKFLPIIKSSPVFPVLYDASRRVLSLPPIINGDHSKIKLTTRNVLIECTATDLTKAKIVLNDIVIMFSQYCKNQYTVEPVQVIMNNVSVLYPLLEYRTVSTTLDYITSSIGVPSSILTPDKIVKLLSKMSIESTVSGPNLLVKVPPSRSDILHPCDIMEDVAIAYGFNNIAESTPKASCVAYAQPLNTLTDALRRECAFSGFTEVVPLILCSHNENFANMLKTDDGTQAVKLSHPKTVEYQVVRTSLLPGILKTIKENRKVALPLRLFEVSDVVFKDDTQERRARNQRNLCAVYCDTISGFEAIHGILDRIMAMVNIANVSVGSPNGYYISESFHPTFFPGRQADVYYDLKKIGSFGIIHPTVLANFDISYPASCLEICVEPFL